jgi:hypothetical protein
LIQADLYDWIGALNAIDAALWQMLVSHPGLILIDGEESGISSKRSSFYRGPTSKAARHISDVLAVPPSAIDAVSDILKFLSSLLRNSYNKVVFNSVEQLSLLLSASSDNVAALAVEALYNLAIPPFPHKQQLPDVQQHTTALHNASPKVQEYLLVLARGWGSRGTGLGLQTCATYDDAQQASLPKCGGEVYFETLVKGSELLTIRIKSDEIILPARPRPSMRCTTAQMFFDSFEKVIGGKDEFPPDKLFSLLASIRLARSFHTQATRINCVEQRLQALIAALYAYPTNEMLSGYFQAQPELCSEIADLCRPTSVSAESLDLASSTIPHSLRILSIETLTAVVARRDVNNGSAGLSPIAKQVNVLGELGVAKGQYTGLLPMLIRFIVASFSASESKNLRSLKNDLEIDKNFLDDDELAIGMAFLEATRPKPTSKSMLEEHSFEFIEAVLSLISAVVATPSGTAALTDCGLVSALVSALSVDGILGESYLDSLRRFIISLVVQILEQAVVTHSAALTAFLELDGIDLLVTRLQLEVDCCDIEVGGTSSSDTALVISRSQKPFTSSRRVLIISIMNCLTVAFHHQQSNPPRSPASYLKKDEMTKSLIKIMSNVSAYGGFLASLCATLLWDVMNADPLVVHHAHDSGLAASFLSMIKGTPKQVDSTLVVESHIPPSSELIMALPNVLSALALTEEGAKIVKEANPFPSMFSIFCSPQYVMPRSRCLLNEMPSIFGTGVDELMRHVPSLRPFVIESLISVVNRIISLGTMESSESKSFLLQYALNIGQMMEQIMQNEDHVTAFIDSGGLEALLQMYPLLMPCRWTFLTHISCSSNLCSSTLSHYSASNSLMITIKNISSHCESQKLSKVINVVESALNEHLDSLESAHVSLRNVLYSTSSHSNMLQVGDDLVLIGLLSEIPQLPINVLQEKNENKEELTSLACFLRQFSVAEWFVNLITAVLRIASQRCQDISHAWSGSERDSGWKAVICSPSFAKTLKRITSLSVGSQLEACRIRTMAGFEERDIERHNPPLGCNPWYPYKYLLRIVCQDGAVLRDGVEIDSSASVGNLEIGETIEAYDRCINSSGVMRYCTSRGWISEHTRGHGKEPIAEVISVQGIAEEKHALLPSLATKDGTIDCGIPDLQSVSASVLSRLQSSRKNLLSFLSRTVAQSIRSIPLPQRVTSQLGTHVGVVLGLIMQDLNSSFDAGFESLSTMNADGVSMYFGPLIELTQACLLEEKRERRILNIPLLLNLLLSRGFAEGLECLQLNHQETTCSILFNSGFLGAIRFVLKHSLHDMAQHAAKNRHSQGQNRSLCTSDDSSNPRVSRFICASLPPTLALLTRLLTRSLFMNSHMWTAMARMKNSEVINLIGDCKYASKYFRPAGDADSESSGLDQGRFCREFHCAISFLVSEMLSDRRVTCVPAHVVHPLLGLVGDALTCLEEGTKQVSIDNRTGSGRPVYRRLVPEGQNRTRDGLPHLPVAMNFLLSEAGRSLTGSRSSFYEPFEPNQETVARLVEMGFSRDHALEAIESTESNRLEIAMEYALSHPPPSPGTIERRRLARQQRRRVHEARDRTINFASSSTGEEGVDSAVVSNSDLGAMECTENSSNDLSSVKQDEQKKVDMDKRSIVQTEDFLKTLRATATQTCFDIIEGGTVGVVVKQEFQVASSQWSNPIPDCFFERLGGVDDGSRKGDAEAEVLTKVVCNFLLDLCTRYPTDRMSIIETLLKRLISHTSSDASSAIRPGYESDFASLCHAAVILLRALPRTRPLVLKCGFLNISLHCIRVEIHSSRRRGKRKADTTEASEIENYAWPRWLPPILLLLDIMAHPTATSVTSQDSDFIPKGDDENKSSLGFEATSEYYRMYLEHKAHEDMLARVTSDIFAAVNGKQRTTANERKVKENTDRVEKSDNYSSSMKGVPTSDESSPSEQKLSAETEAILPSIPCYVSMIPTEEAEICMTSCLKILKQICKGDSASLTSPSSVVHSSLLLLARVLRSHKLAKQCLMLGGAELILSLPPQCFFQGNSGIVTVIMRNLMEDDVTLRCAMEAEIRSTFSRLLKQQGRSTTTSEADERPAVKARLFIQAVTPLIFRDPVCFMKAAATSVVVKMSKSNSSGATRNGIDSNTVVLLTSAERSKSLKAINELFSSASFHGCYSGDPAGTKIQSSSIKNRSANEKINKIRTPHLNQPTSFPPKKNKKEKYGRSMSPNLILNGSPSNHIICILLTELIRSMEGGKNSCLPLESSRNFLHPVDYVEILADLVLAVPACAAAIHRYRPPQGNSIVRKALLDLHQSLTGCHSPPSTAVSYILHRILPQPRTFEATFVNDRNGNSGLDDYERQALYMHVKLAQAAARLLVALCARPGEGRRRVVVDLVYALGGVSLKSTVESSLKTVRSDSQMWSLLSWGELCIGLAAPKSNGVSTDSNATLSWEVTKLMLQYGVPCAVMRALQKVNLNNPLASKVAGALLRPLEVFTRGSVIDTVKDMIKKEVPEREVSKESTGDIVAPYPEEETDNLIPNDAMTARRFTSPGSDVAFTDDAMLEDGFDPYTADRARQHAQRRGIREMVDRIDHDEDYGIDEDADENELFDSEADSLIDLIEDEEEVEEDSDTDSSSSIEITDNESSEEQSTGADEGTEEDSDSESEHSMDILEEMEVDENVVDDGENDEDDESSRGNEDSDQSEIWGGDEDQDFFEGSVRGNGTADDNAGLADSEVDEGWTRIDSSGFPGGVFMARQLRNLGDQSVRQRGFVVDAAETFIGNILRSSDIRAEALEELEDTLGIRLTHRGEIDGSTRGSSGRLGLIGLAASSESIDGETSAPPGGSDNLSYGNRGTVGSFPEIRQIPFHESGQVFFGLGRTNEHSAIDIAFSEYNSFLTRSSGERRQRRSAQHDVVLPSSYETQLFPLGPAAATHTRALQQAHGLLLDVDLPQPNVRFSHSPRPTPSRGLGQLNNQNSFLGGLLSNSAAPASQMLRLNREGIPLLENIPRNSSGNLVSESRWTDDGLPLDSNLGDFSVAFEQALAAAIVGTSEGTIVSSAPGNCSEESVSQDSQQSLHPGGREATSDQIARQHLPDLGANSNGSSQTATCELVDDGHPINRSAAQDESIIPSIGVHNAYGSASDANEGERVAQSLASGLNLSPEGESGSCVMEETTTDEYNTAASSEMPEDQGQVQFQSQADEPISAVATSAGTATDIDHRVANEHGLVCPPGMDQEVFNCLPLEMQQEVIELHASALDVSTQIDSTSGLDPEALAALPEDMRREIILQDQQEREHLQRREPSADPANAEDMDNASFLASLAPDLREEILLTSDEAFLSTLPPDVIAEAQVLRDRASSRYRFIREEQVSLPEAAAQTNEIRPANVGGTTGSLAESSGSRRRQERHGTGRIRVDTDRSFSRCVLSDLIEDDGTLVTDRSMKALIGLFYLLSPVRPHRLLMKVFQNLCVDRDIRDIILKTLVCLLHGDSFGAALCIEKLHKTTGQRDAMDNDNFPPSRLIGTFNNALYIDSPTSSLTLRRRTGYYADAAMAANLPIDAVGSSSCLIPPVAARRIIDTLLFLSKNSMKASVEIITSSDATDLENQSCLEKLFDLIGNQLYCSSSANLEQLLSLIECTLAVLANLPRDGEIVSELSQKEISAAEEVGKEWIVVPRPIIAQCRLRTLCSVLRLESCKDVCSQKVNSIAKRLSRIEENRAKILLELATVAQGLAADAIRDLKTLHIQLNDAASKLRYEMQCDESEYPSYSSDHSSKHAKWIRIPANAFTVSSSSSEIKLLRVLQTLHSLCDNLNEEKKTDSHTRAPPELVSLLHSVELESLWEELSSCLRIVSILEGVVHSNEEIELTEGKEDVEEEDPDTEGKGKKLQSSVAGLLTRLLPTIEAYFMVNLSYTDETVAEIKLSDTEKEIKATQTTSHDVSSPHRINNDLYSCLGPSSFASKSLAAFVAANKVLLNALIRANPSLLDKGLKAMVEVPQCRALMDFDVKRHWFKTQVRKLRQHASRRHGSLRLSIRRKNVFEDAYHQLRLRNSDEMKGRLHISFKNEEGVDAGGLTREFFAILAKEMFNPNYALFTSTEDGCTFQPNPNSSINPDHLSYFRFVGRIVGKAVLDGFLLDAHFTRSLYKHMLGVKVRARATSNSHISFFFYYSLVSHV